MARLLEAQTVIPVFAAVIAVSAAVASVDLLLVRTTERHRSETGSRLYEKGLAAARDGQTLPALELFRSAYNHNPSNPQYHLAFARALAAAGRAREGRAALENLLLRFPAHGPANAEMARVLARENDWQQAAWYYHRALYGEWTATPQLRSLRFELADLLARHHAREQLVSEIVLLDAQPADAAESRRLAGLLLAAGEWSRAEARYRSLLRANPGDAELLAGLARAQLGNGRYVAAERGLRRAIEAGASDPTVQEDLELVTSINAMDPTLRRLAPAEKHRRAHQLAATLLPVVEKCAPEHPAVAEARLSLERHTPGRNRLAQPEADLDTFERLWAAREQACGPQTELPRSLELLASQITK